MGHWYSAGLELRNSFMWVCLSNPSKVSVKKEKDLSWKLRFIQAHPRLSGFSTLSRKIGLIVLS